MIAQTLSKLDYPLSMVLNEFEIEHLVIMHFYLSNRDLRQNLGVSMEGLLEIASTELSPIIKKKSKKDLITSILDNSKEFEPQPLLVSIYKCNQKTENILVNLIVGLVEYTFSQRLSNFDKSKKADDSFIDNFFKYITIKGKDLLTLFGFVHLLGQTEEKAEVSYLPKEIRAVFTSQIIERIFYYQVVLNGKELKTCYSNIKSLEARNKASLEEFFKKNTKIEKLKDDIKEFTKKNKELEAKIKEISRKPGNPELMQQLYDDLKKKDDQIQKLISDIKNIKEKPVKTNETLINNLNDKILELRKLHDEKKEEIRKLKIEVQKYEKADPRDVVQKYFTSNEMDEELFQLISPLYEKYKEPKEIKETPKQETPVVQNLYTIGYCIIEGDKHKAVLPYGKEMDLLNLPDSTYLGEGQFICVDIYGNYKWSYSYKVEHSPLERDADCYGAVSFRNDEPYIDRGRSNYVKVKINNPNLFLREKQVVSVDSNNEFIRYYKPAKMNADFLMRSIKIRGQSAAFVLKVLPSSGFFIRDIETGKEDFKVFKPTNSTILEQQVICYKEDEIINVFNSSKFYTMSSYYTLSYGTVEHKNGMVYAKKLSGEVALINLLPNFALNDGQVVALDEFNNYVMTKESLDNLHPNGPRIRSENKVSYIEDKRAEKISISDDAHIVCVVGNTKFFPAYSQALLRSGHKAVFADGYDSWLNIKREIREANIIVVITRFVSHENMGKIKEEISDKQVIYSEYDGANRIAEEVNKTFPEKIS